MANWCSNTVVFEGKPETIKAIQKLFRMMKSKEDSEGQGQLPDFVEGSDGGCFFSIYWNACDEGVFQYETKWPPNLEIVQKIAAHYKVDFTQGYEEMGNLAYGWAAFFDGIFTDIYLDDEDFEKYGFDAQTGSYHFEGGNYESDYEILETLLERKISGSSI